MSTFRERVKLYFKAGFPALSVETTEEQLVLNELVELVEEMNQEIEERGEAKAGLEIAGLYTPAADKPFVAERGELREKNVYIVADLDTVRIENEPSIVRSLKEMILEAEEKGAKIIFIGVTSKILPSFSDLITVVKYDLPSESVLKELAEQCAETIEKNKNVKVKYDSDRVAMALCGLNVFNAKNILFMSYFDNGTFDYKFIQNEKVQAVKKEGFLEISPVIGGFNQIGGLENLKIQIKDYKAAFLSQDLEKPKGVLCVGIPGTGKSLFAKCVGEELGLPTIRFDFSRVESGLVGSSQQNLRKVFSQVEALAPCVLHIDEIEKAMAGAGTDLSGVTTKLLGMLLTWIQELTAPIFIVATANWLEKIDDALLRRFDETFAIQLPHEVEREEIFKIHLKKRNLDPENFNLKTLVEKSVDYSGAEIEKAIKKSVWRSVAHNRDVDTDLVVELLAETKPIAKVKPEAIKRIQKMIEFATPASLPPKKNLKSSVGKRGI